jgi:hypothetical protein
MMGQNTQREGCYFDLILYSLRRVHVALNSSSIEKKVASKKLNANKFDGASGPDSFDPEDALDSAEYRGFLGNVGSEKDDGGFFRVKGVMVCVGGVVKGERV